EVSQQTAENLYEYGRNLGLAFQIVDDIFDFTSSTDTLGKPAGSDLEDGHITAPVIYALEEKPELKTLIKQKFKQAGDLEKALTLVEDSKGIQRSRDLAASKAKLAVEHIRQLPSSPTRQTLVDMADYVLSRLN
ncbi:MAG: polyprenyl synthetase family protein, partial [Cyanobacteria bacterium J06632_19]